jgi:hypothetical protein
VWGREHTDRALMDQGFAPGDLLTALVHGVISDGLQVVDVVEVDVFQGLNAGIDIARDGQVDEEEGPVAAAFHHGLELVGVQQMVRGTGAADQDIDRVKRAHPAFERHGLSAEGGGQGLGAFVGAVGDEHWAGAPAQEGFGGFLAGVAGAEDHDGAFGEGIEHFFGEIDGHGGDGDAAALDLGFGANLFGDVERALEHAVQEPAGTAVLKGDIVGLLELTEDLGFAEHHGVESSGDSEEVFDALGFGAGVDFGAEGFRGPAMFGEEPAEGGEQLGFWVVRGHIQFDTVAGGQDDAFENESGGSELGQGGRDLVIGEGEALAQLDGRGAVAEAGDEDGHVFTTGGGCWRGGWCPRT